MWHDLLLMLDDFLCQMATPLCAGSAALVRQYYREGWHVAGVKSVSEGMADPSASLVKATMIHSGVKMNYEEGYRVRGPSFDGSACVRICMRSGQKQNWN